MHGLVVAVSGVPIFKSLISHRGFFNLFASFDSSSSYRNRITLVSMSSPEVIGLQSVAPTALNLWHFVKCSTVNSYWKFNGFIGEEWGKSDKVNDRIIIPVLRFIQFLVNLIHNPYGGSLYCPQVQLYRHTESNKVNRNNSPFDEVIQFANNQLIRIGFV